MRHLIATLVLLTIPLAGFAQDAKGKKDPAKKRKPGFTVSKETTYVTGPIDKDGYIDYETALNEKMREAVTPDNNAAVLLFKALGPHPDDAKIAPEFFKWLKIDPPPEQGDYFVELRKYAKTELKIDSAREIDKLFDKLFEAGDRPWTAQEHPDLAAWLKLNEKPLAVAIEATKRTHYYYPLVSARTDGKTQGLLTANVAGVQSTRQLATALCARAMLRVAEKKPDDAWQDLLACHRLGRLVGRGGTMIEGLVGIALDSAASRADVGFIAGGKLDAKQLKKCMADLRNLPPTSPMADKLDLTERYWMLEIFMILDREGVGYLETLAGGGKGKQDPLAAALTKLTFSGIQWDEAMKNSNKFYDRMSAAMRLKDRIMREKELEKLDHEIRSLKVGVTSGDEIMRRLFTSNIGLAKGKYIGDILICLMTPATRKVQHAADRNDQSRRNLQAAFALAAYRADAGNYPKTLDALAPKYLATVPDDLFTSKALVYRPADNGYLLYSVGVNGRDDGGRSADDDPPGDDIAVRMPLPKRADQ